ncbi:hypothetical protein [Archangium sp.]|uniref:hypothetical protein n=1 Tax=Archangium sp. TaxID=1872627 RepID=UPI00389ADB72
MDDERKWEERTHLGPYQLKEQLPQSPDSPGELYVATHEKSGATALVLKPAADEDSAPTTDFRVHVISSEVPSYIALEVEDSRRARARGRHSAESLMSLLEEVREGLRRMARALDDPEEPRFPWRLGLALAGTAAVCALFFALGRLSPESPPPSGPELLANTPLAPTSDEVSIEEAVPDMPTHEGLADTVDAGTSGVTRPLPSGPFKGQKRPPCKRPSEVELVGGCWMAHELKAPCPEDLYEFQGKCYVPAVSAKSAPPQSVDQ